LSAASCRFLAFSFFFFLSHFAFQGGAGAKTPKKTPKSGAAERTPGRVTRSSLADDLPQGDDFEFRPDVDAPLETPGRQMRPSPRATIASPTSGVRRPSAVLGETPSPAKRTRGAAASPAKVPKSPSSASEVDFQDFKRKCVLLPRGVWKQPLMMSFPGLLSSLKCSV
jgi:hypothetical protein